MFKKCLLIILLVFSANLSFASYNFYCAPEHEDVLERIEQLPEVQNLLEKILEEGPVAIRSNNSFGDAFEGYWSYDDRTVYVTRGHSTPLSAKISTILFELHNANRHRDLTALDDLAMRGQISKKNYVRSVEFIEYQNAKATSGLLEKGIAIGIFPKSSRWPIADNFEDHFRVQRKMGHSQFIANNYDDLCR